TDQLPATKKAFGALLPQSGLRTTPVQKLKGSRAKSKGFALSSHIGGTGRIGHIGAVGSGLTGLLETVWSGIKEQSIVSAYCVVVRLSSTPNLEMARSWPDPGH